MKSAFFLGLSCSLAFASLGCLDNGTGDSSHPSDAGVAGYQVIDAGGPIAEPPDGGAACPSGACNYQTGSGCSAAETCSPGLAGDMVTQQCTAGGSGKSGDVCASSGECAVGYLCVVKSCHKLCCGGDWSACPSADEHCINRLAYAGPDGGAIETGAMLCFPVNDCDALKPDSCTKAGTSCQIVDATGATACFPSGTGDVGQPCPCKGGFTCAGGVCHRLCKAVAGGGDPLCQPGEGACVHFSKDPPGVGECMPWVQN